jgi:urease accessory protein
MAPQAQAMRTLTEHIEAAQIIHTTLTLSFVARQKSRQRVRLDNGEDAALLLPRGTQLRDGDLLGCADAAFVVQVRAAPEQVSHVQTGDPRLLARCCYHLGNRHVPVQIGDHWLRYLQDSVLDELIRGLGLQVQPQLAPFEPEAGAYAHGAAPHHHAHE